MKTVCRCIRGTLSARRRPRDFSLALGLLCLVGCASPPYGAKTPDPGPAASTPPEAKTELSIEVYERSIGVVYDIASLVQRVDAGAGGSVLLRLSERDIERCVLGPAPSPILALHLRPEASARWLRAVGPTAETLPFTVSARAARLFVGVTYPAIGAAAIDTPVLHTKVRDGHVVLTLGMRQGAALMENAPPDTQRRIDRPELRAAFAATRALREEPRPPRFDPR